jgi:hypothetical protein
LQQLAELAASNGDEAPVGFNFMQDARAGLVATVGMIAATMLLNRERPPMLYVPH